MMYNKELRKAIFSARKVRPVTAYLVLEDGSVYEGTAHGAFKETVCEVVFNTSMTGYLEILTDPPMRVRALS